MEILVSGITKDDKLLASSDTRHKAIHLKEVKIRASSADRNTFFNPKFSDDMKFSTNLNGPGHANEVILGENILVGGSLLDVLPSRTFGVSWENGTPYNRRGSPPPHQPMMIIIEGAQVSADELKSIPVSDLYSVEVLRSASYLVLYGSTQGALIITLKHGSGKNKNQAVSGVKTHIFSGYYKASTFSSSKYEKKINAWDEGKQTIYWKPNIVTTENGKASFEFFNREAVGNYKIVIEGIDGDGNLGRNIYRFKVE